MSDFQHKPDSGSLFKNDKREKDTQPNAKGSALIDGVEYWVSAWTNDGKNGKYQSLKFERKDDAHRKGVEKVRDGITSGPAPDDFDDEIPF
jgi:hypothetical protein